MQATPPFLGARVLAPSGGERAGSLTGRLTRPPVGRRPILGGPTKGRTTNRRCWWCWRWRGHWWRWRWRGHCWCAEFPISPAEKEYPFTIDQPRRQRSPDDLAHSHIRAHIYRIHSYMCTYHILISLYPTRSPPTQRQPDSRECSDAYARAGRGDTHGWCSKTPGGMARAPTGRPAHARAAGRHASAATPPDKARAA